MHDPTAAYRSTQITSGSPADRVVLLYRGAIRFGRQSLAALECGDRETAHRASIRCQAIVAELAATLDPSAGPIAHDLRRIYDFVLGRLVAGNVAKEPGPAREALEVLGGLLEAWQEIAWRPAGPDGRRPQGRTPAAPATQNLPPVALGSGPLR